MKKLKLNLTTMAMIATVVAVITFASCDQSDDASDLTKGWKQIGNYPGAAVTMPMAFSINGKVYIGGGYVGVPKDDLWEYNPAIGNWTQKSYCPITPGYYPTYFVVNNKAYVCNGSQLWEYNPANDVWTRKADYPYSVPSFGFGIKDKGYVFGTLGQPYSSGVEYNPATDTWKQCATMGNVETYTSSNQYGYVIIRGGGFYIYNPDTDRWMEKAALSNANVSGIAFNVNGVTYGGMFDAKKDEIYKYDSDKNSWSLALKFPGTQRSGAAAVVCNNKLYIGLGGVLDFWEYDFGR